MSVGGETEAFNFNEIPLENFATHILSGEINEMSIHRACEFVLKGNQVFEGSEPLTLFINSCGGSVTDGFALIDLMEQSAIPIKTIGIGGIMSMGLMIFMAGAKKIRIMTRNTIVMSHQFSTGNFGKYHELAADIKGHQHMKHMFVEHCKRHTKLSEKKIITYLFGPSDAYLTPRECLKYGICDHIVDELPDISVTLPSYTVVQTTTQPKKSSKKAVDPEAETAK